MMRGEDNGIVELNYLHGQAGLGLEINLLCVWGLQMPTTNNLISS